MNDIFEPVIGLEIHVQLNTESKLFSSACNRFGDEPNVNISEVCTGQPGALPVLNQEAVKKAIHFGLAINAKISTNSTFERKSYFYPDSPRNFQITQLEHPIIIGGIVTAEVEGVKKEFQINRAHLEDDAGMLKHFSTFAGVDYNRAGVPLLEIVSEPVIYSSKEAVAYVMAIKGIMEYIDASDCNMEEGSLRVDANISVRKKGETTLRNKTEIKNMNSFTFLEMAVNAEIKRQIEIYTKYPNEDINTLITPGTYRWDADRKETILMRKKEAAADYRYFPEPDLPPLILSEEYIDSLRQTLPELPQDRYKRYITDLQLSEYNASLLISDKMICDFFEEAIKTSKNKKSLCNWITVEFLGRLKEKGINFKKSKLKPEQISKLVNLIEENVITGKIAKKIADEMVENPNLDCEKIIKDNPDYQPMDDSKIEPIVEQVVKENEKSVIDYKQGKTKAFAFLVGQVMKLTKGKANPELVNKLLQKKLKE